MADIKVFFDLSKFDAWVKKFSQNAGRQLVEAARRDFQPVATDAVEVLQRSLVEHMRQAGLHRRIGIMEETTEVKSIREKVSKSGVQWEVEIKAPIYAMFHDKGGVIVPKPGGRALTVPIHPEKPEQAELQEKIEFLRAQKRTFILYKGKGQQPLKRPLLMYKTSLVGHKKSKQEYMEERYGESTLTALTESERSEAKSWWKQNRERLEKDAEGGTPPMVPLFSLHSSITMPSRPWFTNAVREWQLGVSDVLSDASTEFNNDKGFSFTIKRALSLKNG